MKSGLPSVRRWMTCASSLGNALSREPLAQVVGDRRPRRAARATAPGHRPRARSSRVTLLGRVLARTESRRPGGRCRSGAAARAPAAGRAARAGRGSPRSLQCRSSSTRTRGACAVSASTSLRHLAQHALARGPEELSLQRVPVAPRRGATASARARWARAGAGAGRAGRPPLSRQSRPKASSTGRYGSLRAVRLDTLALRDPDARIGGHALEKGVDDRRLADARLARHEDDLASCRATPRRATLCEPIEGATPGRRECPAPADRVAR